MSPHTSFIRLSRRQDGRPVPPGARAGPNSGSSSSSSPTVSSTPSSSPSSTVSQTSSQTSSSPVRPAATTTSSSSSSPSTSSPETSSSVPSTTRAPTEPTSSPIFATPASEQTVTVTSSFDRVQSSQSPSQAPSQSSHTSFFQNKPAMIAVFSVAGVLALILVIVLGTAVVRRRRRDRLIKEAIDFSPTAAHLVNVYDDGGRGDNDDDEKGAGSSLGSISGNAFRRAQAPLSPSLISPPVPVPPLREAQQQGPGTGFAGSGISYDPYYETGRPQWQQQLLHSAPQQQPLWRQQQAEWLQQQDFQPDTVRHPSALVPAHHQVAMQASQVPFARPARTSPPPGAAGRMRGLGPSQTEYVQAPSPAALNLPDTLRRGGGNLGVVDSSSGQDFGRSRILKVVNEYY